MNICVIPAKGNSRRLPGKNKMLFKGKPMVQRAIESAQRSYIFNRIIVSSDDLEILSIAASFPYVIPLFRLSSLSGDDVSVDDVVAE